MLDDTRLRIFLSAVQTGNFTRTAKEFGITQPAVSQNISDIEKAYGIRLFDRGRGNLALTPEGRVFLNYATGISSSYDELNQVFRNFEELSSVRSLHISIAPSLLPWAGTVLLPYIYKVCPETETVLSTETSEVVDLKIKEEGGVRLLEPSVSFSSSALFKLLERL